MDRHLMTRQPRYKHSMLAKTLIALLLASLLGGCNLPAGVSPTESQGPEPQSTQDLSILATLTQQALEKGTQVPTVGATATQPPTATPQSTTTAAGEDPLPGAPAEIKFRLGGTMAYLEGDIAAGQEISFTFEAAAGQTLIAGVSSEDQDVFFEIKGLGDGSILTSFTDEISSTSVVLPSTQVYRLTLTSRTDNTYFLTVEIPANLPAVAGSGPLVVDGYLDVLQEFHPAAFTRVRYLLDLEAGTTLDVQLSSPGIAGLTLALTGMADKVPYLRHVVKTDAISGFSVPLSQAYALDVYSTAGEATEYSLEIEVSP